MAILIAQRTPTLGAMELEFSGKIFHWRGPAPFHLSLGDEVSIRLQLDV